MVKVIFVQKLTPNQTQMCFFVYQPHPISMSTPFYCLGSSCSKNLFASKYLWKNLRSYKHWNYPHPRILYVEENESRVTTEVEDAPCDPSELVPAAAMEMQERWWCSVNSSSLLRTTLPAILLKDDSTLMWKQLEMSAVSFKLSGNRLQSQVFMNRKNSAVSSWHWCRDRRPSFLAAVLQFG